MSKPFVQAAVAAPVAQLQGIASSVVNSCIGAIDKEMTKQGLYGGLRDSRKLRDDLFALIYDNIIDHHVARAETETHE